MNAVTAAPAAEVIPTVAGTPFGGGIFSRRLVDKAGEVYLLIVAPIAGELEPLTWKQAAERCAALRIDGHADWQLPDRVEALCMFEDLRDKLRDTDDAFDEDDEPWYWTSQPYESGSSYAWFQVFITGYQINYYQSAQLRARAVRRFKLG